MKKSLLPPNLLLAIGLSAYFILLIITALHRQPPLHDEPYFLANVAIYNETGLTKDFLLGMQDQAPGPLYQFVHAPLTPLTRLQPPGVRLVNIVLLGIIIMLLAILLAKLSKVSRHHSLIYAMNILAVPMIWQVAGMALTEIPATTTAFLSTVLLFFALERGIAWKAVVMAVPAGLLGGLAILGRSPFLVLPLSALLMTAWYAFAEKKREVLVLAIYITISLGVSLPVFYIWNGFMPPQQAYIGTGISIWHGILGFSYAGMVILLIAPQWFYFSRRIAIALAGIFLLFLMLNFLYFSFSFTPLSRAIGRIMPEAFISIYPYLISPLLATLAVYVIVCMLGRMRIYALQPFYLFLALVVCLLLASNMAVTHLFSSRYVATVAPFLIPLLVKNDPLTYWKSVRYCVGTVLGLLSLETYFNFQ